MLCIVVGSTLCGLMCIAVEKTKPNSCVCVWRPPPPPRQEQDLKGLGLTNGLGLVLGFAQDIRREWKRPGREASFEAFVQFIVVFGSKAPHSPEVVFLLYHGKSRWR